MDATAELRLPAMLDAAGSAGPTQIRRSVALAIALGVAGIPVVVFGAVGAPSSSWSARSSGPPSRSTS